MPGIIIQTYLGKNDGSRKGLMMRFISKRNLFSQRFALCFTLAVLCGLIQAQEYSPRQLDAFRTLTTGVESLGSNGARFTAIAPLKPSVIPLFWGNQKAYTGDKRWPQNSYPPVAIASEYHKGRFVALGHDGLLSGMDNQFADNIFNWLGNDYRNKSVIIYKYLDGWFNESRLTAKVKNRLAAQGVKIIELSSQLTDEDLKKCDLLIIIRPSKDIGQNEIQSIASYVEHGGSILISGMGWLWQKQNPSSDISEFPLNKLGEVLGFEYSKTSIGKTPPNNKGRLGRYSVIPFQPLSSRKPVKVKHYSIKDHDNRFITDDVAQNQDRYYYTLEGEHIIVSMPYTFWAKCQRPVDFITQLDTVYNLYTSLTDGVKPFNGHKILILNVDNLCFRMCSGNPVLSRQDRIGYILSELEKSDYKHPSWGLMHELGHDFVTGMKHSFVLGNGDNESWANVFALYGCHKLQLEPANPIWKKKAEDYLASGEHNFIQIRDDAWLMLGFLNEIKDCYGWEVFEKMFKRYAKLVRENNIPNINATKNDIGETRKKIDFFVKELSLVAGVNFAPYFKKWGFPVNLSVNDELKHLPPAKLFE